MTFTASEIVPHIQAPINTSEDVEIELGLDQDFLAKVEQLLERPYYNEGLLRAFMRRQRMIAQRALQLLQEREENFNLEVVDAARLAGYSEGEAEGYALGLEAANEG